MAMRDEGDSAAHSTSNAKCQEESSRNGYVKSCVTPLKQDRGFSVCRWCNLERLGLARPKLPAFYVGGGCSAFAILVLSIVARRCLDEEFLSSLLQTFQSAWAIVFQSLSPLFSICCAFFWLTFYLRKSKRESSTAWLLSLPPCCYLGDFLVVQVLFGEDQLFLCRLLAPAAVLGCVGLLTLLSTLKVKQSVLILLFSSVVRLASITSLIAVPAALRPLLACGVGMVGAIIAVYFDYLFPREARRRTAPEEKIPVIKPRRRSSCVSLGETSTNYYGGSKMPRRTSLPCISREQGQDFTGAQNGSENPVYLHVPRCPCAVLGYTEMMGTGLQMEVCTSSHTGTNSVAHCDFRASGRSAPRFPYKASHL